MKLICIELFLTSFSMFIVFVNTHRNFCNISLILEDFTDLLFQQIQIYQVFVMNDHESQSYKYREIESLIFKKLTAKHPTQYMTFPMISNTSDYEEIIFDRSAVLFVSILESKKFDLEEQYEFMNRWRLSTTDSNLSKYLLFMFSVDEEQNLDYLLEFAWSVELIDVLIYEIVFETRVNSKQKENLLTGEKETDKKSNAFNLFADISFKFRIHQFNPFTKQYYTGPYNRNTQFFPDKFHNLYQYKLRVGFVDYPPYGVAVEHQNQTKFQAVYGELINTLSGIMNFTMVPTVKEIRDYGVLLPNGSATGLLGALKAGKIDIIAFGGFVFYVAFMNAVDRTSYLSLDRVCPLVPMISARRISTDTNFVISCGTIIVLVTIIYFSTFLIRTSHRGIWYPLNIGSIILGIVVPEQPERLRERFLYGCILVVSLFYSSNIFAHLTNINLAGVTYMPFSSFEEMDEFGLIPVVHPNWFNITFGFADEVSLQNLGKRASRNVNFAQECPKQLVNSTNVTCVVETIMGNMLIKMFKDPEGKAKMKFGNPFYWSAIRAYILRKASSYTGRFSKVIMHVTETGLMSHWWLIYSYTYSRLHNVSLMTSSENPLAFLQDTSYRGDLYFVLVGNTVPFCVFVGELIFFHYRIKVTRKKSNVKQVQVRSYKKE